MPCHVHDDVFQPPYTRVNIIEGGCQGEEAEAFVFNDNIFFH